MIVDVEMIVICLFDFILGIEYVWNVVVVFSDYIECFVVMYDVYVFCLVFSEDWIFWVLCLC